MKIQCEARPNFFQPSQRSKPPGYFLVYAASDHLTPTPSIVCKHSRRNGTIYYEFVWND